jgi:hypothetical protein
MGSRGMIEGGVKTVEVEDIHADPIAKDRWEELYALQAQKH